MVPVNYVTSNGFKLGTWVNNQRQGKSKNLLSQDRLERLEALPGWSWNPVAEQWEEAFEKLQSYVNQYGNARVPANHVTPDGLNLGAWVSGQRNRKSKNLLTQDRIERLEALPGWSWNPVTEQWEEAFEHLQSYVNKYGNAKVSYGYVNPEGFRLGRWVSHQRDNKTNNLLSQDRIERLEALPGWSWDPFTEQWEEAFEQLQSYVNKYGNARVNWKHITPDGFKLASWVSDQRKRKSKSLLSQDRIERLEALPGWVWSFW